MASTRLYYSDPVAEIQLYCGDSTQFDATDQFQSVITDPIWPNNKVPQFAGTDGGQLLRSALARIQFSTLVVHFGGDSDPRSLVGITDLPFLRACWLRYACPSYKGRVLYTADIAYVFGQWPDRAGVWPGECTSTVSDKLFAGTKGGRNKSYPRGGCGSALKHVSPRRLEHVEWLVRWYGQPKVEGKIAVYDPFVGSGTTLLAAKRIGVSAVGVEIEERYCELAARRLEANVVDRL